MHSSFHISPYTCVGKSSGTPFNPCSTIGVWVRIRNVLFPGETKNDERFYNIFRNWNEMLVRTWGFCDVGSSKVLRTGSFDGRSCCLIHGFLLWLPCILKGLVCFVWKIYYLFLLLQICVVWKVFMCNQIL